MTYFTALLDGAPGAYGVVFPDAPGCNAMADTADEALTHAQANLAEWLEDGPVEVRPLDVVRADPEVQAALAEGATLVIVPDPRRVAELEEKVGVAYQVVGTLLGDRFETEQGQRVLDYLSRPGEKPDFMPFV